MAGTEERLKSLGIILPSAPAASSPPLGFLAAGGFRAAVPTARKPVRVS